MTLIERIDAIEKQQKEIVEGQREILAVLYHFLQPEKKDYIRNLAKECAQGNWSALRAHNKSGRGSRLKST